MGAIKALGITWVYRPPRVAPHHSLCHEKRTEIIRSNNDYPCVVSINVSKERQPGLRMASLFFKKKQSSDRTLPPSCPMVAYGSVIKQEATQGNPPPVSQFLCVSSYSLGLQTNWKVGRRWGPKKKGSVVNDLGYPCPIPTTIASDPKFKRISALGHCGLSLMSCVQKDGLQSRSTRGTR